MFTKIFLAAFTVLAAAYLGIGVYRFLNQSKFVYHPSPDMKATPADQGMAYQDVYFYSQDGLKLNGWFIPAEESRMTMLVLHGNGGNITHRLGLINIFNSIGASVFIIDYRGYGLSQGDPSEQGTYLDGEAAMAYLINDRGIKQEDIVVYGRSLGGAIAAWVASIYSPKALILDSTFTSIKDLAAQLYPLLPVRRFLRFKYDTLSLAARAHCPVLVIHSKEDDYIPYTHALKIYSAIKTRKDILTIKGDHNQGFLVSADLYKVKIKQFLA